MKHNKKWLILITLAWAEDAIFRIWIDYSTFFVPDIVVIQCKMPVLWLHAKSHSTLPQEWFHTNVAESVSTSYNLNWIPHWERALKTFIVIRNIAHELVVISAKFWYVWARRHDSLAIDGNETETGSLRWVAPKLLRTGNSGRCRMLGSLGYKKEAQGVLFKCVA